jgi:hypothetical protein
MICMGASKNQVAGNRKEDINRLFSYETGPRHTSNDIKIARVTNKNQ